MEQAVLLPPKEPKLSLSQENRFGPPTSKERFEEAAVGVIPAPNGHSLHSNVRLNSAIIVVELVKNNSGTTPLTDPRNYNKLVDCRTWC